ncbi:MAG TPA: hypothetical protein HPQ00_04015, partial [Magnetococcales bacterium]|nr:hypothetical protein [Magnetococcales bacterium]
MGGCYGDWYHFRQKVAQAMSMLLKALEGVERDRGEREGGHPGDIQDAGEPAFLKKKKGREAGLLGILAMEEKREDRFRGPDAGSPVGDAGGAGGIAGAATVSSLLFELDDGVKPKAPMGDAAEMVLPGQGQEPLLLVNACAGKQGPTCDHRELGWDSPDKARLLREAASREPVRSRKRLYIGGGALAMLGVLTYGGYVYWQSMMLPSFSMPRPPLAKQIAPPAPPPGALTVSATALSPVSPPSVLAQPPSSGLAPAASPPPVSPSSNLVGVSQVQIPIPPSGSAVQKVET